MFAINTLVFLLSTPYISCLSVQESPDVGIIGGHDITIEKVPFIASLRLDGKIHFCGCSIIDEQFVLSAAHCIVPNREYKVLVGTSKLHQGGSLYDVEKILVHPKYNNRTYDYDISILKLKEPLVFSTKVNKIDLFDNSIKMKSGTILKTVGWGYTEPKGNISETLRVVQLPKVSRAPCQRAFGNKIEITRRMICAGGEGKDTCKGDSGGPLIWKTAQVGITSFGSNCGSLPGVYTNVFKMAHWITRTIAENL
ncbi:unnamed protein product [Arctia plantaginis]|uniref:trypsin n=1 Tax=Arctia plantaginis TaxID=874455 RepID=A0A8S1AHW1_ARCPL|nr:unnamed protein product [Arctia plantaginis]CAB3245887.1 unnamed protein product [Arctia plantaginis]